MMKEVGLATVRDISKFSMYSRQLFDAVLKEGALLPDTPNIKELP
jgi:hypothetical protein